MFEIKTSIRYNSCDKHNQFPSLYEFAACSEHFCSGRVSQPYTPGYQDRGLPARGMHAILLLFVCTSFLICLEAWTDTLTTLCAQEFAGKVDLISLHSTPRDTLILLPYTLLRAFLLPRIITFFLFSWLLVTMTSSRRQSKTQHEGQSQVTTLLNSL